LFKPAPASSRISKDPQETAYPRLPVTPKIYVLQEDFSPTPDELAFAKQHADARFPIDRLLLLVQLKSFALLKYFLDVAKIPEPYFAHLSRTLGIREIRSADLKTYARSTRQARHLEALRKHFNVRPFDAAGRRWLAKTAETTAASKHYVGDIANVLLSEIVAHGYELPSESYVVRLAASAREQLHEHYYKQINDQLNPDARSLLDGLLSARDSSGFSGWNGLKREPKKPTTVEIRSYLAHIERFKKLVEQLPAAPLPPLKIEFFRDQARASDAQEMSKFPTPKRYALAVIFIRHQYARVLDDAADLFMRMMSKIRAKAEQARLAYQLAHKERTDTLIKQLDSVLEAYDQRAAATKRIADIQDSLTMNIEVLRAWCKEHLSHAGPEFQPYALEPFAPLRPMLLNCLEIMGLKAANDDRTSERMIEILLKHRLTRGRGPIEPETIDLDIDDLSWLSPTWRKFVIVKTKGSPAKIHRGYFELAVLTIVDEEIRSGDLFIPDGDRFDDFREQLSDDEALDEELPTLGTKTGYSTDGPSFVKQLKKAVLDEMSAMDKDFPDNPDAHIINGRLKLTSSNAYVLNKDVEKLDQQIRERMPQLTINEALLDTVRLLDLSKHFRHVGGDNTRLTNMDYRVVATLLTFGCFIGPTQAQRSIEGLSRKQIAWLNIKYFHENSLQEAIDTSSNKYNEYELPRYWGSGKSVAADGTKWSLYEENMISTYHIRHRGSGGLSYVHVSDKYIALISNFYTCGIHEGTYLLDVVAAHSDIQPTELHGDTHSQSYTVFGLAYLLGYELMPRIRGVNDYKLFRADDKTKYKNIHSLIDKTPIKWDLIETHFRELLRFVVSIKRGVITPSTILRRLASQSRKNKLYFALRELGRAVRTRFLLRYIASLELRETIHAVTNKNEQYHQFAKSIAFGNGGVIADNLRHEQLKVIRYNNLVANLLMIHNIEHMSRIIAQLQEDGHVITQEQLEGLAPYRLEHLNLYGKYDLDMTRPMEAFDPARVLLKNSKSATGQGDSAEDSPAKGTDEDETKPR